MKLANIVVDVKTNFDLPFFTYKITPSLVSELKIGQSVRLPFGKKTAFGYVVGFAKQTEIRNLKEITAIVSNEPILLPYQIKLAFWMAKYYHTPVINCIKLMLPPFIKKNISPQNQLSFAAQTLILVPTLDKISASTGKQKKASKGIAIYHNKLTGTERYDVWQKVYDGSVQTIIGTRLALFLPFPSLTKIIIKDQEDQNFIEKRSPYYHTGKVAQKLAELLGISLVFESETPGLESFFRYKDHKNIKFITKTSGKLKATQVKIIDLGDEKNRRQVLLSRELKNIMKQSEKQKILLFCFRMGLG